MKERVKTPERAQPERSHDPRQLDLFERRDGSLEIGPRRDLGAGAVLTQTRGA